MTKEVCSMCKYGDGKWRIGRLVNNNKLPVCDICKKDGWEIATPQNLRTDPILGKHVNILSPLTPPETG